MRDLVPLRICFLLELVWVLPWFIALYVYQVLHYGRQDGFSIAQSVGIAVDVSVGGALRTRTIAVNQEILSRVKPAGLILGCASAAALTYEKMWSHLNSLSWSTEILIHIGLPALALGMVVFSVQLSSSLVRKYGVVESISPSQ